MKTLYDALQVEDPAYAGTLGPSVPEAPEWQSLTGKDFARHVLDSIEFRRYIITALNIGELPPAIILRMMDYVWGKPIEKVEHEHTGKDGQPIVTEVRRVIIRASEFDTVEVPTEVKPEVMH